MARVLVAIPGGLQQTMSVQCVLCILFGMLIGIVMSARRLNPNTPDDILWRRYKQIFNLRYYKVQDDRMRYSIFRKSLRLIRRHNRDYKAGRSSYTMGVNQFTHLTFFEFKSKNTGIMRLSSLRRKNDVPRIPRVRYVSRTKQRRRQLGRKKRATNPPPIKRDLRDTLCITPVCQQGSCGASYAFAMLSLVEYHYCMHAGGQVPLSAQQIIDCSASFGNAGCDGGSANSTETYVNAMPAIATRSQYPYREEQLPCSMKSGLGLDSTGLKSVKIAASERAEKRYIAFHGPLSVTLRASENFQFYESGVLDDDKCDHPANHAMMLVGYGRDREFGSYWLLKNSHGVMYGEGGYIRIRRGKNMCRIADHPLGVRLNTPDTKSEGYDCDKQRPCTAANRAEDRFYFPFHNDPQRFVQCDYSESEKDGCWVMSCAKGASWNKTLNGCDRHLAVR